jgi:hypothetical protein
MSQMFDVVVTAQGEVRDSDGALVSSEPLTATVTMTAEQVRELIEGARS